MSHKGFDGEGGTRARWLGLVCGCPSCPNLGPVAAAAGPALTLGPCPHLAVLTLSLLSQGDPHRRLSPPMLTPGPGGDLRAAFSQAPPGGHLRQCPFSDPGWEAVTESCRSHGSQGQDTGWDSAASSGAAMDTTLPAQRPARASEHPLPQPSSDHTAPTARPVGGGQGRALWQWQHWVRVKVVTASPAAWGPALDPQGRIVWTAS